MGLRFRKSVKICKGVKINLSKSGASLSLGGKGSTFNFSGRGAKHTIGLPGTGFSYTTSINKGKKSASRKSTAPSSRVASSVSTPSSVNVSMNDKGKVTILDENGNEIIDASIIRKIKATSSYKAMVENLDRQRREKINEMVSSSETENQKFIDIYTYSSYVKTKPQFEYEINNLKPKEFEAIPYDVEKPNEESIRKELTNEANEMIKGFFLTVGKQRKKYVEEHLFDRLNQETQKWEKGYSAYNQEQTKQKEIFEKQSLKENEEIKRFLTKKMNGDEKAICDEFDSWINEIELPVEININYDWFSTYGLMLLDVDLPEIEDLPQSIMIKTDSGNIKEKKKTQAELRGEYAKVVFGLAVMISSHVFAISPAIKDVAISGYTQRRNKAGGIFDAYVYSINFKRNQFEHVVVSVKDPIQFCLSSENRINMTSTSLLKEIKPFEYNELI